MKKIYKLVSVIIFGMVGTNELNAQAINESFTNISTLTTTGGWAQQNLSTPLGTVPTWTQGDGVAIPAFSGAATECIYVNYNSVAGANTISNWLFTPTRTFSNGDVIKFYTRTVASPSFADRLQLRLSTNGTSVNAGSTNVSVGDFTTLLLDINPTLVATNYPNAWTQYSVTISGLGAPVSGRAAFRYFVTSGGPSGSNSDLIAIDDFEYLPLLGAALNFDGVDDYVSIPYAAATTNITNEFWFKTTQANQGLFSITDVDPTPGGFSASSRGYFQALESCEAGVDRTLARAGTCISVNTALGAQSLAVFTAERGGSR